MFFLPFFRLIRFNLNSFDSCCYVSKGENKKTFRKCYYVRKMCSNQRRLNKVLSIIRLAVIKFIHFIFLQFLVFCFAKTNAKAGFKIAKKKLRLQLDESPKVSNEKYEHIMPEERERKRAQNDTRSINTWPPFNEPIIRRCYHVVCNVIDLGFWSHREEQQCTLHLPNNFHRIASR